MASLDLAGCVAITERSLAKIVQHAASLHTLKIGGTSRVATVTDATLRILATATAMTHLDLSGCLEISDAGVPLYIHRKYCKMFNAGACRGSNY